MMDDAGSTHNLSLVRRFEAASFRAWPAETVRYDGAWQLRLTPGHSTKRPNCLVPLDRADTQRLAERVSHAEKVYAENGIQFVVKETPLCPPELTALLEAQGFRPESESIIKTVQLGELATDPEMDILPSHDTAQFMRACIEVGDGRESDHQAMQNLFERIEPEKGFFLYGQDGGPARAVALCVRDGLVAGLNQVAVAPGHRRQHLGQAMVSAALKWARLKGATTGWLAVEAANGAANALYDKLGFVEIYRYRYWRKG